MQPDILRYKIFYILNQKYWKWFSYGKEAFEKYVKIILVLNIENFRVVYVPWKFDFEMVVYTIWKMWRIPELVSSLVATQRIQNTLVPKCVLYSLVHCITAI